MHPTEDRLLAYLDGEVAEEERRDLARHLETCGRCADALDEVRRVSARLSGALERLDRAAPALDPATIRRRAGLLDLLDLKARGARDAPPGPGSARPAARSGRPGAAERPRRSLVAAAALLLAFTGAAAAIPGSPLRAWLVDSARAIVGLFEEEAPDARSPDQEAVEAVTRLPSGVAVAPYGGRVRIALLSPSPDAVVRVRVVDAAQASVLATDASYRTGAGSIEVIDAGPGEVRIEIPRSARSALVEVDGRAVVEKEGADLRLLTPADTSGSEIFFRPGV